MKRKFKINDIIVIGGDFDNGVVKWAEYNGIHGLYTGFRITEVTEDNNVKINGFEDVILIDNIYEHFTNKNDFFQWVRKELEQNRTYEEMEVFENDFDDFLM